MSFWGKNEGGRKMENVKEMEERENVKGKLKIKR
jgi:hypothetical protein